MSAHGQKRKLPEVGFPAAQSLLVRQSIALNVHYDQPQADWDRVVEVYRSMPGWRNGSDASWFGGEGDPEWIWASVEPSGILIEAQMARGCLVEMDWRTVRPSDRCAR